MQTLAPLNQTTLIPGSTVANPYALPMLMPGMAADRLNPVTGIAGATASNPMFQALQQQDAMLTAMMAMMLRLMMNSTSNGAGGADASPVSSISGGGGGGSAASGSSSAGGSSAASGSSAAGGNSGPVGPGVQGALDKARSMIGLNEKSDTAEIQKVTGKSGINPSTTPWCAAFAMNILKDSGAIDTTGLKNMNYCPEIVRWAKEKGNFGARGSYQPKPGDAIMFDWEGDGTSDHIGIVEKVEGGKVTTIEGNSSDSVKRNSYDLTSSKIMGYVKSKG